MDLIALAPSKEPVFLHLPHPVIPGKMLYLQMPDPKHVQDEKGPYDGPMVDNLEEPIGLYVVGSDSEEFAARERWLIDQRIKRAEALQQGKKVDTLKAETLAEESINTLVACIKGFRNVELNGRKLEHLPNDARLLLTTLKWVRDFLDREIVNRANFIKA